MKHLVSVVETSIAQFKAQKTSVSAPVSEKSIEKSERIIETPTEQPSAISQNEAEHEDINAASTPQQPQDASSLSLESSSDVGLEASPPDLDQEREAQRSQGLTNQFLRFEIGERNFSIILDTEEVVREDANILATHSIAHAKSPDLL